MSYRILSCASCEAKVRFLRDVPRKSVVCPECGQGMELILQDKALPPELEALVRELSAEPLTPPESLPGYVSVPKSDFRKQVIHRLMIAAAMTVAIILLVLQLRIL